MLLASTSVTSGLVNTPVQTPDCPGIAKLLMADSACCSLHVSASLPLRPNMTSSIKSEVHNVAQRRQNRTEPWPQGMCTQNFVKIGRVVPKICLRTDRRTHELIAIPCAPQPG